MKTEKMAASAILALVTALGAAVDYARTDQLSADIYSRANAIFTVDGVFQERLFASTRAGGFEQERMTEAFADLCSVVSNNIGRIAADWRAYETNEVVRFTTLSAAAFSGYENMTNLACSVLSLCEADTNSCSLATLKFLCHPYGTKANAFYLDLNYDQPGASNIVSRIKALAVSRGDMSLAGSCDKIMSGENKRECMDMMLIGDWWH